MMMRVNANTASAARVGNKTSSISVAVPRRAVSVAAIKEPKEAANSSTIQESARSGLAAVSAFCLGVSLLVSPVEPAQAVLPPDNGAGLIKSGANNLPQPLNKLKESATAYKDPATESKKDNAQYSDVDYTKKASEKIKGGLENIKESITGAAEDVKGNASDAALDIKSSANKLSNKVAFLGIDERAADKISESSKDIANNAKSANAFLAGKASKAVDNVKAATGNAVENVKAGASDVSDKAENGFSKVDMSRVNLKQDNSNKVAFLGVGESAANKVQDGAKDLAASGKQTATKANAYLKGKAVDVKSAVSNKVSGDIDTTQRAANKSSSSIPGNAYLSGGKVSNVSSTGSTEIQGNAYLQSKLGRDVKSKVDGDVQATKNTASSISNNGLTQAKEGAKDALKNVSSDNSNAKSVNAFIKNKASAAKDAITNKVEDLGSAAKDASKNIKYGAKDAAADVKANVKSVAYIPTDTNDVQSSMTDLAKDAQKIGGQKKDAATQFKQGQGQKIEGDASTNGLKKAGDSIKAAAQKVVNGVRNAAKA